MDNPAAHEIYEKTVDNHRLRSLRGILTPFGWCVVGPLERQGMNTPRCHDLQFRGPTDLGKSSERFVDDDMFGAKPKGSKIICPDDKSAL